MVHTIYLDILFCVNFIIDYMILVSVKKFLSISCRLRRLLLGAAVGGISSFVILLPPMPSGFSLIISLATAFFVIGSAFAPLPRTVFLKASAAFFMVSFAYCGIMIALWLVFSPDNMVIRNSSVYIAISPIMLVLTALFCYVLMRVIIRITGKGKPECTVCTVKVLYQTKDIIFQGKLDTGNTLKEPFSGTPVIVAKKSVFADFPKLRQLSAGNISEGIRLVPFATVGGGGMLPAFKAERVFIRTAGITHNVGAYIALCDDEKITGGDDAVIPYELIS